MIDPEPRSGVGEREARASWGQRPRRRRGSQITTRLWLGSLGALIAAASAATASASSAANPTRVTGEVVETRGRTTADGRYIVTDVTIRTIDGTLVTVTQPGGSADGFAQRSLPGALPLTVGERVSVQTRTDVTASGASMLLLDRIEQRFASREGGASAAGPFVRGGPSKRGNYVRWASSCAHLEYNVDGTTHLDGDRELAVLDEVLATWAAATQPETYLDLVRDPPTTREVGSDLVNVVIFREDRWCRPAVDDLPEVCHNPAAAGITLITYIDDEDSDRDGELVDADIEINGVNFAISDQGSTLGTQPCLADLANIFTHELGHFMGLDHTCQLTDDDPEVDHLGNPVPSCFGEVDPSIREATMYPSQECGETKKTSPEADDILGIQSIYAAADDPGTCERPTLTSPGCCSAQAGGATSWAGPALLVLIGLAWPRRRRRARR